MRAKKKIAPLFAAAVLGGMGVAIALILSGDAAVVDDKTIFCSEYVPNAQAESNYAKWLIQNSGEKSRWELFRDAICAGQNPVPPTMTTAKGRGLAAAGKMALPETPPPPTTTTTTTTTTTPPPVTSACPGNSAWSACFDGNWNGWDGFNGAPNGGIGSNGGYSFQNSYFSFASTPSMSGQSFKATVDANAGAGGQAGERTLIQHWPYGNVTTDGKTQAYQGQDQWYRDFIRFPASYQPVANTSFNWVWEAHNWPDGPCCAYLALGVVTNAEDGGPAGGERLSLRILGGGDAARPVESTPGQNANTNPTPTGFRKTWVQGPSIQRDHWYDVLIRVKWDSTNAGRVEWYLDGQLMIAYDGPTLYWYADNNTNVSGSTAGPGLGYLILGNYRQTVSGQPPSTVYHDTVLRGPTRASVGG